MQLYCHNNKNKSVATRWGRVSFDSAGYADHDIPAADLPMVKALKWDLPGPGRAAAPAAPVVASKPVTAPEPPPEAPSPPKAAETVLVQPPAKLPVDDVETAPESPKGKAKFGHKQK